MEKIQNPETDYPSKAFCRASRNGDIEYIKTVLNSERAGIDINAKVVRTILNILTLPFMVLPPGRRYSTTQCRLRGAIRSLQIASCCWR